MVVGRFRLTMVVPPVIVSNAAAVRTRPMFSLCGRSIQGSALSVALTRRVAAVRSGVRGITSNVNTVDASEIELFSRLSSQWWDERGEFAMLHRMNPVRMEFIKQKLREVQLEEGPPSAPSGATPLEGLDILDVGCGGGLLSEVRYTPPAFFEQTPKILLESRQAGCQDHRNRRFRSKYRDSFDPCCRRSPVCPICPILEILAHNSRGLVGGGETV